MDEGYIGGRRKGERAPMRGGRQSHLSVVAGIVERNGGRIVARVDPMTKPSVRALVKEYVLPETIVFTDEAGAFHGIGTLTERYQHRRVNHLQKVYFPATCTRTRLMDFGAEKNAESAGSTTRSARSICRAILTSTRSAITDATSGI